MKSPFSVSTISPAYPNAREWQQAADLLFNAENPKLVQLSLFFSQKENMDWILPLFHRTKRHLTKTLIEWTIITLARICPLEFTWDGDTINIANEYATFRSQGTKEHSDPFCRKPRGSSTQLKEVKFDFVYDGTKSIETTEAQLTFLKWTIVRGILPYITQNSQELNRLYTNYNKLKNTHRQIQLKITRPVCVDFEVPKIIFIGIGSKEPKANGHKSIMLKTNPLRSH